MHIAVIFFCLIVSITITNATNQYLGCFIDQIGKRDLTIFIDDYEQLTPRECIIRCQKRNYPYAALQYGSECRCGQHYGSYGQASEDECDHLCSTSEKCGGYRRNSVYRVNNSLNEYKTISTCQNNLVGYLGCFPTVSLQISMNAVDSLKECIHQCTGKYIYAGVANGNLCYCGNELIVPLTNSNQCNIQCNSSSDITRMDCCGGQDVSSVYHIPNYQSSLLKDQPETIIRAINDSTQTSHATVISTEFITSSPSYSSAAISSSTHLSSSAIYTTSSTLNNTYSSIYTSLMMSSVSSATLTSSGTILTTLLTTSHLNTNTASTVLAGTTSATSISSTSSFQSSTNHVTTIASSITSTPSISSSFHTVTSEHTGGTTMTTIFSTPSSSVSFGSSITSMKPTVTFTSTHTDSSSFSTISSLTNTLSSTSLISTVITTNSQYTSPTISSSSTQITTAVPERSSSGRSIVTALFSSTSTFASSSSTYVRAQTTMTSSFPPDITTQTTITTTTTTTTTASTTISLSFLISTILIVNASQTFDPYSNTTRESIRQNLIQVMNLAFLCYSNPSAVNCTQTKQRNKRQTCASGYNVNLVSNITEISTITPKKYQTNYTVLDSCNGNQSVAPVLVKSATDRLSRAQITNLLGYDYENEFIRSTTIATTNPVSDQKLWIIGAVLGPVAFTILLIFIFCYLHYKCRPRHTNQLLAKPIRTAPALTQSTTNPPVPSEALTELPAASVTDKSVHILTKHDPLVGASTSLQHLTPTDSNGSTNQIIQQATTTRIPMDEIRRQNDVERWRNKLRLQEQHHVSNDFI
ncbi:unnamed protein product [Adineta ricciae]|uniref:WSC domain-containing protein n=1 Tax=Adineta ricciae TaxID=249248 RepID=A0A814D8N6_ADIRI|nr:unnamed protein product [Adineta ricciae]